MPPVEEGRKGFMGLVRRAALIGPDGEASRRRDHVEIDGHADQVLAAVGTLP